MDKVLNCTINIILLRESLYLDRELCIVVIQHATANDRLDALVN